MIDNKASYKTSFREINKDYLNSVFICIFCYAKITSRTLYKPVLKVKDVWFCQDKYLTMQLWKKNPAFLKSLKYLSPVLIWIKTYCASIINFPVDKWNLIAVVLVRYIMRYLQLAIIVVADSRKSAILTEHYIPYQLRYENCGKHSI